MKNNVPMVNNELGVYLRRKILEFMKVHKGPNERVL